MKKLFLFLVVAAIIVGVGLFIWEKFFDKSYLPPEDSFHTVVSSPSPIPSQIPIQGVRVIVSLKLANYAPEGTLNAAGQKSQRAAIQTIEKKVLASLPQGSYKLIATYDTFPTIAVEADPDAMAILKNSSDVLNVREDIPMKPL